MWYVKFGGGLVTASNDSHFKISYGHSSKKKELVSVPFHSDPLHPNTPPPAHTHTYTHPRAQQVPNVYLTIHLAFCARWSTN